MCGSDSRTELPLTALDASGCGCCSTAPEAPEQNRPVTVGTAYDVEGLSCGHCANTVEKAVAAVGGVDTVSVELVPDGTSRLIVTGAAARTDVRNAVSAAGYAVTGSR